MWHGNLPKLALVHHLQQPVSEEELALVCAVFMLINWEPGGSDNVFGVGCLFDLFGRGNIPAI